MNEMNSLLEEKNGLLKRIDQLEEELMDLKMEKVIESYRKSEEREVVVKEKKETFGSKFTNL